MKTPLAHAHVSPGPAAQGGLLAPPQSPEHAPLWLAQAIEWAAAHGVTDLHLFPSQEQAMLWARVDGELRELAHYSIAVHERMVARLKVMGRCTDYTGELVQEGRFSLGREGGNSTGEARLSILPTLRGDKAVIRLLGGAMALRPLEQLGFPGALLAQLRAAVDEPQGLVLATGPAGCGKSTALYALLADLNKRAGRPLSILTIEDPVEQTLPFAAQIGVDPARGLNFDDGLRAVLRQDPEVIMIGEIRDAQTAATALQAALTGHRLLSSMHTLCAAEALVRLQQMGIPPYVVASALAGVLNVRLVRVLCGQCKVARALTPQELELLPEAREWEGTAQLAEPVGCEACMQSGHQGRTAVGEWVVPTPRTAAALSAQGAAAEIAATLATPAPVRPAVVDLLRQGQISPEQWHRLGGMASLHAAGPGQAAIVEPCERS